MTTIHIGDKEYNVKEAHTEEEKRKGLQEVTELPKNEGMLFFFDEPQEVSMWMQNTLIPLDIIFINEDDEAIKVVPGVPNAETPIVVQDTLYVLEGHVHSGIQEGDQFEIEDDGPIMKVLAQDGTSHMSLFGGDRIFSRKNTVVLIRKAKKADETKSENDLRARGRYMFKCIKGQDERPAEYVKSPE